MRKKLKDMFKFVSEDDDPPKDDKEQPISENMEEYIKWKKDWKRLYLHIPKWSGYGYWINYTPGQARAKWSLKDPPKKNKGPTYEDILNRFLAAEGIRPMPEKKPEKPLQKVEDLSPWPHKTNVLLRNNKFMNT